MKPEQIQQAIKWTLASTNEAGRATIMSVFMIRCEDTQSKGSGFLLSNGYILTAFHVVNGANVDKIRIISADGRQVRIAQIFADGAADLFLFKPNVPLTGGLDLDVDESSEHSLRIGEPVQTWGYPLGHEDPPPLLSVGYLSGFVASEIDSGKRMQKRLVVNGAFNSGNSGGVLLRTNGNKVIGIVCSKRIPLLTQEQQKLVGALAGNPSGVMYSETDEAGNVKQISESQVVARVLESYRGLVQVMIGEAIASAEILNFLKDVSKNYLANANKLLTEGKSDQALPIFIEAAKVIEPYARNDRLLAEIYWYTSLCYEQMHKIDDAMPILLKAKEIFENLPPDPHKSQNLRVIADKLKLFALNYLATGKGDQALPIFIEAAKVIEPYARNDRLLAEIYWHTSLCYEQMHKIDDAMPILLKAKEIFENLPPDPHKSQNLRVIADKLKLFALNYLATGKGDQALPIFIEAAKVIEPYARNDRLLAEIYWHTSLCYEQMHKIDDAILTLLKAKEINESLPTADPHKSQNLRVIADKLELLTRGSVTNVRPAATSLQ